MSGRAETEREGTKRMGNVTHGSKKKKNGWDGRRKAVSAVAAVMALLILIPLVVEIFQYAGAVTMDDISRLTAQQAALETKKSKLQDQISDLKDQENSAAGKCNLLGEKITVLEDQIATTQDMVAEYATQIKTHQKQLKGAKEKESSYYKLFCERVRSMEEDGAVSYWQILFSASDFSDFLDRVSFINGVMGYDDDVLKGLTQAKETVAAETKELKEQKGAKQKALYDLKDQKGQMKTASSEAVATLKEIKSNRGVYAAQLSSVDSMADDLASDIVSAKSDYAAEQKAAARQAAKDAAAAKKAAREAKEKAAAEAKEKAEKKKAAEKKPAGQKETKKANTDAEKESRSDPSDSQPDKDTKKQNKTPSEPTEQAGKPPVSNSVSGASIVNFALQFVGDRYVWGGENLSTGVDCSGFVMCVYAHYGYSLPHSSSALANCGKGVSYANAQMGDIICYNGHCGMYIGGGKMVNALGVKYGIVVSNVNMGRLVAVRRIV